MNLVGDDLTSECRGLRSFLSLGRRTFLESKALGIEGTQWLQPSCFQFEAFEKAAHTPSDPRMDISPPRKFLGIVRMRKANLKEGIRSIWFKRSRERLNPSGFQSCPKKLPSLGEGDQIRGTKCSTAKLCSAGSLME